MKMSKSNSDSIDHECQENNGLTTCLQLFPVH